MRSSDGNPLDLNNFPDDDPNNNKQVFEASSSSSAAHRKKKSSSDKEGKDECGKVYECRFCSLKFCKSQALGGHMNRHRQERETETLNRARQLVFGNDTLAASSLAHPHLGCPSIPGVCSPGGTNMGDASSLGFRSIYPSGRMFSGPNPNPSSLSSSPYHQQYIYPSHSPSRIVPLTPQHHRHHNNPPNEYCIGHVLAASSSQHSPHHHHHHQALNSNYGIVGGVNESNYTCMGAPLGPGLLPGRGGGNDIATGVSSSREVGSRGGHHHHHHDQEGMMVMNWERSYGRGTGTQQRIDPGSLNNRFQDGF